MQLAAARSPLSAEAVAVEWSWLLEGRACPATARALHACARRFGCADIWTRQDSQPARAERVLWHQLWQRAAALAPRYIPGRSSQEGAVVVLDPHPPGKPMVLDLDSLLVEKRTNNLSEERSSGSIRGFALVTVVSFTAVLWTWLGLHRGRPRSPLPSVRYSSVLSQIDTCIKCTC